MKNNIKKLSKSIYLLLIFIKSESRISKELIEIVEIIYKGIIDKKEIRNVDIKDIVKKLKKSKEVYFSKPIQPIIRELEKTIVFSIQKTKIIENQMLKIYEEVLGLILEKYKENEFKKIKTIASSTHNLPMFLINKENKKSYNYIWNVEIGFYERVWNEKILEKFKYIFIDEEKENLYWRGINCYIDLEAFKNF